MVVMLLVYSRLSINKTLAILLLSCVGHNMPWVCFLN